MLAGNLVFALHSHLPWVINHGKWPHGEDWLFEAVAECYIPILNLINELKAEDIKANITISLSPILIEQLSYFNFPEMFANYCNEKIEQAEQDFQNYTNWNYEPHQIYLAKFWKEFFTKTLEDFESKYNNIVNAFKTAQDEGLIEIFTCGATHGYFPLLGLDKSINTQVELAVRSYEQAFGRKPKGIWLPECAYRPEYEWQSYIPVAPINEKKLRPGIEQFLAKYEIEYFFTDEDLINRSELLGWFADNDKKYFLSKEFHDHNFKPDVLKIYNVASTDNTQNGTAQALSRHLELSMQVWSGQIGYPAESDYLDFHKKEWPSLLRYWRVTDTKVDMAYKSLFHPDWTDSKIDLQSNHFIHHLENTVNHYKQETGNLANLTLTFDTELFGHWWFEGPKFIKAIIKGLSNSQYLNMETASKAVASNINNEVIRLAEGSWGKNNTHEVWTNPEVTWTWESIYNAEVRFDRLVTNLNILGLDYSKVSDDFTAQCCDKSNNEKLYLVALQAFRELLLMQSSDWQFLISTGGAVDYAQMRFFNHYSDFNKLSDIIETCISTDINDSQYEYYIRVKDRNPVFLSTLNLQMWKNL